MVKFLLYAILVVLCWPVALLVACIWIPYKFLVVSGKITAWSFRKTAQVAQPRPPTAKRPNPTSPGG